MITIYVPEFTNFNIFRDRNGYTVRRHWVTAKGSTRNIVVGNGGTLLGALGIIEQFLKKTQSDGATFTLEDLQKLQEELGGSTDYHISNLDKYRTQIKALWTAATHPKIQQVLDRFKSLDKDYRQQSIELFPYKVFQYNKLYCLKTTDSFNYMVKVFYRNNDGELNIKEAWTHYPSNLHRLVDAAIHSEIYCRLKGNNIDINTYIATYISFINVFCDEFLKNHAVTLS